MPTRKSDLLMNSLMTLLLAGILGVCGLGVTIARDTLTEVRAIDNALGKEVERTTADRERSAAMRDRLVTMIDRLASTQERVSALEAKRRIQ